MDPAGLAERFTDINAAWTGQRWPDWAATCAPGYLFEPYPELRLDVEATLDWSRAVFRAYPDYTESIDRLHVSARAVVAEVVGRGTHLGDFTFGRTTLPASGQPLRTVYAKILVFDDAGQVTHDRQYQDRLPLLGLGPT